LSLAKNRVRAVFASTAASAPLFDLAVTALLIFERTLLLNRNRSSERLIAVLPNIGDDRKFGSEIIRGLAEQTGDG
jgi:hypothetical protein